MPTHVAHDDNEPRKIREELSKIEKALKGVGVLNRPLHVEVKDVPKAQQADSGNG